MLLCQGKALVHKNISVLQGVDCVVRRLSNINFLIGQSPVGWSSGKRVKGVLIVSHPVVEVDRPERLIHVAPHVIGAAWAFGAGPLEGSRANCSVKAAIQDLVMSLRDELSHFLLRGVILDALSMRDGYPLWLIEQLDGKDLVLEVVLFNKV